MKIKNLIMDIEYAIGDLDLTIEEVFDCMTKYDLDIDDAINFLQQQNSEK